jgi:hypothetical protein
LSGRAKKLEGLPGGDPRKVALETVVRARTVASCGWLAGGEAENAGAASVSQTLRKTEWKNLMKRLPRTLAEYISLRKQTE